MTAGTLLALLLALVGLILVVRPLLRSDAGEVEQYCSALSRARELQSRRDMSLASLKDLEDDRATDKIGDEDFEELHARLSTEAIEVMQQLDELEQEREAAAKRPLAPTLQHPGARAKSQPR